MGTKQMSLEVASSWAGSSLAKMAGVKGVVGLVGAVMLYMLMPPGPPLKDGAVIVNAKAYKWAARKELAIRFAFAFLSSEFMGDWFVEMLCAHAAWLHADAHPNMFIGAMGAFGWYAGRWVALWLHKRQNTGIDQVVQDVRELIP